MPLLLCCFCCFYCLLCLLCLLFFSVIYFASCAAFAAWSDSVFFFAFAFSATFATFIFVFDSCAAFDALVGFVFAALCASYPGTLGWNCGWNCSMLQSFMLQPNSSKDGWKEKRCSRTPSAYRFLMARKLVLFMAMVVIIASWDRSCIFSIQPPSSFEILEVQSFMLQLHSWNDVGSKSLPAVRFW